LCFFWGIPRSSIRLESLLQAGPLFWGQAIPQVTLRRRLDLARNAERAVDGVLGLIAARWVDAKLT
jgi:hypothetical protein